MCSPQVSAGVLLHAEECVFRAVSVTRSGRPDADVPILLHTKRVSVTLRSVELYDLDPDCAPDVLGLDARRPEVD